VGATKNTVISYAWYNVIAATGNEFAIQRRDEIEGTMTPTQIHQAQKQTKELMKMIKEKVDKK
jgi:hypothetical protein